MKKSIIAITMLTASLGAYAGDGNCKDYLQQSLKDGQFKSVIYQYRHTPEYQAFKDAYNSKKQDFQHEMQELAKENHPLALYLMSEWYSYKGQTQKYHDALISLYVISDGPTKNRLLWKMANPIEGQELSKHNLGALGLFTKGADLSPESTDAKLYQEAVTQFGEQEVYKQTQRLNTEIARAEKKASHHSFNLFPENWLSAKIAEEGIVVEKVN